MKKKKIEKFSISLNLNKSNLKYYEKVIQFIDSINKDILSKEWYFNLDVRVLEDQTILSKLVYSLIANTSTYDDFADQFIKHIRLTPNFAYFMLFNINKNFIKGYKPEDIEICKKNKSYYVQLINSMALVSMLNYISILYNEIYKFYYDVLSKDSSNKGFCYKNKEIETILNDYVSEDKNKAVRNIFLLYGSDTHYKHIDLPKPLENIKVDNNFRPEQTDQLYLLFNIIKPIINLLNLLPTEEEIKNNNQNCYNSVSSKDELRDNLGMFKEYTSDNYLAGIIRLYFKSFGESMYVMFGVYDAPQYESSGLMIDEAVQAIPDKLNKSIKENIYINPDLVTSIVFYDNL